MPICDDPQAFGFYSLRSDRAKPFATRPMFKVRFFTRSKAREVARTVDDARKTDDDTQCFALLMEALRGVVIGWRNFGDAEFSVQAISERLTDMEIWELANNFTAAVSLTEDDLKNSGLPPTSGAANSASNVSGGV